MSDYEMFSDEGNALVGNMIDAVFVLHSQAPHAEVERHLTAAMRLVAAHGHREVYDTAVREAVARRAMRMWGFTDWLEV
jgi:hypothetical protein